MYPPAATLMLLVKSWFSYSKSQVFSTENPKEVNHADTNSYFQASCDFSFQGSSCCNENVLKIPTR